MKPICGYWFGDDVTFDNKSSDVLNLSGIPQPIPLVFRQTLGCGLRVAATENGLVLFDFEAFKIDEPASTQLQRAPFEGETAVASVIAPQRVEILNAHQLCLIDAIGTLKGDDDVWGPSPRPVSVPTLWVGQDEHAVSIPTSEVWEFRDFVTRDDAFARGLFRFPVERIERSIASFERVLAVPETVRACHATLNAMSHCEQFRFDQGLITGWAAAEVALGLIWARRIEAQVAASRVELTQARRQAMIEMRSAAVADHLLVAGEITPDLYGLLQVARGERNKWAHELRSPSYEAATSAIHAAQQLINLATGCAFDLQVTVTAPSI